MYSKNDYRYYLEHQLFTSGGYLEHYGVTGMHWGIRRYQPYSTVPRKSGEGGKETGLAKKKTKIKALQDRNSAKIKSYRKDSNSSWDKKRIANLESKNSKFDKKLSKIDTKQKLYDEKDVYRTVKKGINDAARRSSKEYLKGKISTSDYDELMDTYGSMAANNKSLYKVEKAKIKHPETFESTYKIASDYMRTNGSSADDYIVSKARRDGSVEIVNPVWSKGDLAVVNGTLKTVRDIQAAERKKKRR